MSPKCRNHRKRAREANRIIADILSKEYERRVDKLILEKASAEGFRGQSTSFNECLARESFMVIMVTVKSPFEKDCVSGGNEQ